MATGVIDLTQSTKTFQVLDLQKKRDELVIISDNTIRIKNHLINYTPHLIT